MNRFFPNYQSYKITSPYGMRTLNGTTSMHNGIDLVAKATNGTSMTDYITAHSTGTVTKVGYEENGAGYYVFIETSTNVEMAYFHMKQGSIRVSVGQKVNKGQVMGYMGNTGRCTGAHLHFGIKKNGKWIDPTPYLDNDFVVTPTPKEIKVTVELTELSKGSKGEEVKTLQSLLGIKGYSLGKYGIDGDFGDSTLNAVKQFQKENKLACDGIVGPATWNKLLKGK